MRPAREHREVQQPPLRQGPQRRLCARGQLPAERAGPARGPARGLPLQLRDVAGEGGLLPAHPVGGAAAESVMERRVGGGAGGEEGRTRANLEQLQVQEVEEEEEEEIKAEQGLRYRRWRNQVSSHRH